MGLGLLRKKIGEKEAARIWEKNFTTNKDGCVCPMCSRTMKEITVDEPAGALTLDVCQPCNFVWFDAGECEFIPPPPPPPHVLGQLDKSKMNPEQLETFALLQAQRMADEERKNDSAPYEDWKTIPGLLGLPVELDIEAGEFTAWTTWLMAFAIAVVSLCALYRLDPIVQQFGLIPNEAGRYCGLTFLTSFFLHTGVWHLVGNLYFLIIFGRAVERDVGPWRWLLLLFAAAFVGDVLDIMIDPRGDVPTIGASGGISGVLAYYTLKFPSARLAIMIRFIWVELPAWVFFAAWIGIQTIGARQQIAGEGDVASLAHLGGVAVGVAFWLLWRKRPPHAAITSTGRPGQIEIKVQ